MGDLQEQWIVVGGGKRKKNKKGWKTDEKYKTNKIVWETGKPLYIPFDEQVQIESFINSKCFQQNNKTFKKKITQKLTNNNIKLPLIHIQCLGLGDFLQFSKPHFQYLFLKYLLLPLCQQLSIQTTINTYDPIFTNQCIQELSKFCTTKPNHIPQRQQHKLIILYMPHCQRFLYERYCNIYINNDVIVIGNSLQQYISRCKIVRESIPDGFLNRPLLRQTKIQDFKESFNDTYCYFV